METVAYYEINRELMAIKIIEISKEFHYFCELNILYRTMKVNSCGWRSKIIYKINWNGFTLALQTVADGIFLINECLRDLLTLVLRSNAILRFKNLKGENRMI